MLISSNALLSYSQHIFQRLMPLEILLPRLMYERERLLVFGQRRFCYPGHVRIEFVKGTGALEEVKNTVTERLDSSNTFDAKTKHGMTPVYCCR